MTCHFPPSVKFSNNLAPILPYCEKDVKGLSQILTKKKEFFLCFFDLCEHLVLRRKKREKFRENS